VEARRQAELTAAREAQMKAEAAAQEAQLKAAAAQKEAQMKAASEIAAARAKAESEALKAKEEAAKADAERARVRPRHFGLNYWSSSTVSRKPATHRAGWS
jgi:hypothetical protein